MPNPLMGMQQVTSKEPAEHSEEIAPVVETYEGDNNPYRGTVDHGVPGTNLVDNESEYLAPDATLIAYTDEEVEPDPIPVRIVQTGAKDFKAFSTGRVYATGAASIVVARRRNRTSVRLRNLGTKIVYIGPNSSTAPYTSWPIPINTEWEYEGEAEVWAVSEDGSQQELAVFTEFVE